MPDHDHDPRGAAVHDLNNSLAAIVAFSQLIRTDPSLPEGLRRQADMLIEEADRTRRIVATLVDASAPTASTARAANNRDEAAHEAADPAQRGRVLVLDDEPAIRDFLTRILRRSGYEAVAAADGASALAIVQNDPPDAILCDHRMVGMSGIAFHEAVAAIDAGLARHFVFMSGDVLNAELSEFARSRGITLLAKPFDIESVDRTVAGLMEPVQPVG